MPRRVRLVILLVALVTLLGVATPPVLEDHVEAGFCSADCPLQHEGGGIAITSPLPPSAARGLLVVLAVLERGGEVAIRPDTGPAAPRAPPSV
jgi:hypothetical protein